MAASAKWFGVTVQNLFGAAPTSFPIAWVGDECRVSLHSGAVPDATAQDTWDYFNDAANELATAGGYTAGGVAINNKTLTYDSGTNTVRLKGDPVSWAAASFSATWASIRKYAAGVAANAPLLGFIDFGGTETVANGTFQITPDATDGYLRAVVAA